MWSLGAAALIHSGAGPTSRVAAKTADEFHSRAYALRKRGNFEAAIEEYAVGARFGINVVLLSNGALTLCVHVLASSGA